MRPEDTLTLEFGLGKKITDTIDVGVVAHTYRQVTGTTGADAVNPLKCRSHGVGGEIQYLIANKYPAKARAGYDFEARNFSQGPWVALEFNPPF